MFIDSLTLINYKPFLLRGIKKVSLNFNSIYQLIIGTNGTGKSSILRQLSPLPAISVDFAVNGSKEICIRHKTDRYRLVSTYTEKGGRHEFWFNETNLNDSGTITSQRELVQHHFSLTQSLFTLLMGETKFTNMSATERRNWLLTISGMNLDFAMEIYERLRVKTRDTQNLFKHYTKRYNSEVENLPTDDEITYYQKSVDELNAVFLDLNKALKPDVCTRNNLIEKATEIHSRTNSLVQRILSKSYRFGNNDVATMVRSDELASQVIRDADINIKNEQTLLTQLQNEQYQLTLAINEINKGAEQGCSDIQQRIIDLGNERDKLLRCIHLIEFSPETFEQLVIATEAVGDDLTDILTTSPPNVKGRFSDDAIELISNNKTLLLERKTKIELELDKLGHQIKHMETGERTQCPKCEHTWIIGAGDLSLDQLNERIAVLGNEHSSVRLDIQEIDSVLELYDLYVKNNSRLNRHYRNIPAIRPLLLKIAEAWNAGEDSYVGLPILTRWHNDIAVGKQLITVLRDLEEADKARSVIVGDYEGKVGSVVAKHAVYEERIESVLTSIEANKRMMKQIREIRQSVNQLEKQGDVILSALNEMQSIGGEMQKAIVNETLEKLISHVRDELAKMVTLLNKARNAKAVVDKLKVELDLADRENKIAKLLVKLISPTDGLIAEKLSIFMDNFVEQMNFIISQIWAHDFYLVKCQNDGGELDYIFPTKIANSAFFVPDVSQGSSSQVDIVNFAFRLVVMIYLSLEDYPIYLDELAPSLDETHRANIIAFIKEFIDARQCSQMFMISHYVANHGVFTQAEVCVTDKKNILTLPAVYNQHCSFT